MPIPESQLETWSHQGAVTTSKQTHESIRNALDSFNWADWVDFEPYLQGSYRNATNIRGDSDVDVVVQLNSSFRGDVSELSNNEQILYNQTYSDATYQWANFRTDVIAALRDYYQPSAVDDTGDKALKVAGESGRLPADVVVCLQYRKYKRFSGQDNQDYVEGISFYTLKENRRVINFPKIHYNNGTKKHGRTSNRYKPTVRVFKNARTYLIEKGIISKDLAPSYFLECLLYNVLDEKFTNNYQDTFCYVVNWLAESNLTNFMCQNEQLPIFGDTPEQWSISNAQRLVQAFISLWNNWYQI